MNGFAFLWMPLVVAWAAIALLRGSRAARRLADQPNERSLHVEPTPRIGGLGILAGALPFALATAGGDIRVIAFAALALAVVSFADDLRGLPVAVRLAAHSVAALMVVLALPSPAVAALPLPAWVAAAAVLAIVWMTNLFNFMDGADGLAGGMAATGFAAYAIAAHFAGHAPLAAASAALAAACAGFLLHNFPPARVFMGDAGSVPLGFLAAALGLHGAMAGAWPAWFPAAVFLPFIADASVTLLRRLLARERVWRAHRNHYYQRLVLSGWTPRRLALASCALMVAVQASALAALTQGAAGGWAIILAWSAVHAAIFAAIERRARR